MLAVESLTVGFAGVPVVADVTLEIPEGRMVALLGLNGSGKSVCLKAIGGLLPTSDGTVSLDDRDISHLSPERRAALGIAQVSQTRGIFASLTVEENLRTATFAARDRRRRSIVGDPVLDLLPELRERLRQPAGTLSGGERTLLALGRALMMRPKALLADEPTAALAPTLRTRVGAFLSEARDAGLAVLFAEQNVGFAIDVADEVHVLRGGRLGYSSDRTHLDEERLARELRGTAT